MEELKEKGIHHTVQKISDELQSHPNYKNLYKEVQKLVTTPNVKYENFKETLNKALKDSGIECQLRNNVYYWMCSRNNDAMAVDNAFFKKAQIHWDKRIHKSLNSMCTELGITLAKLRSTADKEALLEKWGELSNYEVDVSKYRPVYAPKDFLEVLLHLKSPAGKTADDDDWEFCDMPLEVKELTDMRLLYSEFSRGEQIFSNTHYSTSLEAERLFLGEKVLCNNYAPVAQEYLKKGCPRSLRADMWALVLGANVQQYHKDYYDALKEHVIQFDLMIDKLIIKDIQLTASNDDQYFVFEDVLYQILLCFSRDNEILQKLSSQPGYMQVVLKGKQPSAENTMIFPPSGVIPFHGFAMYAAPICYLYQKPATLYYAFRSFYLRFWHRLHRVCGHSQGIVSLCLTYERLLQTYEPVLWLHFNEYNIHPLRVVFKWLMRAFSGALPPEQLLQLWDLILAYDSLEILPLLAVSILIFRRANLLRVTTVQNIEAVLADLSSICVIPLLQMTLLKE